MPSIITDSHGSIKHIPVDGFRSTEEQPEPQPQVDWQEQMTEFSRRQQYRHELDPSTKEVSVYTETDQWQMLVLSGDKHIGSDGFDWARFQSDSNMVINTPNVHEVDMGDIVDNLFFNAHEDIFNLQEQVCAVNSWAKAMLDNNKMLCAIGGNHQEWLYKIGVEFYALTTGFGGLVPYMREGGFLNWKVGEVIYRFRLDHKTKYNSDLNPNHTNHRTYWMVAPDCDVIASAHTHSTAIEEWAIRDRNGDRQVQFVKTGSYKLNDRYKDQNGFIPDWQTGSPCLLLSPKERLIYAVSSVDRGIKLLESLNR